MLEVMGSVQEKERREEKRKKERGWRDIERERKIGKYSQICWLDVVTFLL